MRRRYRWFLALMLFLALAAPLAAQVSHQFDLSWSLLSGGGGVRSSENVRVDDVLGQWVDGRSTSDNYQLDPGFWHAGRVVETRRVFLPLAIDGSG